MKYDLLLYTIYCLPVILIIMKYQCNSPIIHLINCKSLYRSFIFSLAYAEALDCGIVPNLLWFCKWIYSIMKIYNILPLIALTGLTYNLLLIVMNIQWPEYDFTWLLDHAIPCSSELF